MGNRAHALRRLPARPATASASATARTCGTHTLTVRSPSESTYSRRHSPAPRTVNRRGRESDVRSGALRHPVTGGLDHTVSRAPPRPATLQAARGLKLDRELQRPRLFRHNVSSFDSKHPLPHERIFTTAQCQNSGVTPFSGCAALRETVCCSSFLSHQIRT